MVKLRQTGWTSFPNYSFMKGVSSLLQVLAIKVLYIRLKVVEPPPRRAFLKMIILYIHSMHPNTLHKILKKFRVAHHLDSTEWWRAAIASCRTMQNDVIRFRMHGQKPISIQYFITFRMRWVFQSHLVESEQLNNALKY